ncbi:hypothetical protein N802_11445 [Knoellia sinensis KCTC 19936]|uniref:Uncharacterized protein n=1 Tax=Knoellia sinensis KCTC 19936 TaxID=1385520 RepID=A0A0A0IY84_9MICO|nr:hypothetical protein [Knoellia sinensis]KGN29758.1 hypothetical protein N802_11445 [Knoellia sinensis KCTC 19936]
MVHPVATVQRGWRLLVVFVLAVAVVGMHSMGAGHHGSGEAASHHQVAAGATHGVHPAPPAAGSASHHAMADPETAPSLLALTSVVVAACHGCLDPGFDAMGAMCLAVVSSLLALALLLALRHRRRSRAALILPWWSRATVAAQPPLRRMALSPIEVCVLRT